VKSRRTNSHRIAHNWIRWRRTTRSKSTEKSTLRHQFHYQCSTGPVLALLLAEEWAAGLWLGESAALASAVRSAGLVSASDSSQNRCK